MRQYKRFKLGTGRNLQTLQDNFAKAKLRLGIGLQSRGTLALNCFYICLKILLLGDFLNGKKLFWRL